MGHRGKDMTCTKVVMVSLKCSPLRRFQDKGLRVPPGPPENHPVNRPILSSSNPPPQPPSGAPMRLPISLPMKRFQPPAEPWKPDVATIAELPPLPEISYDDCDADDASDDLFDWGGAVGKSPASLKQTKFSLKHFAKRIGQTNYSAFDKWKTVWVAGFLKEMYQSIIQGQNQLKYVRDNPLDWELAVAEFLETFGAWLPLDNFDNAE
jgi:hypothetical protein